jgi:uncharacterized membrane protein
VLIIAGIGLIVLWRRITELETSLREVRDFLSEVEYAVVPRETQNAAQEEVSQETPIAPVSAPETAESAKTVDIGGVTMVGKRADNPPVIAASEDELASALSNAGAPDRGETEKTQETQEALTQEAPAQEEPELRPNFWSRFSFDFEELIGRRLSVWAGGIALAISGIFLVIYSIEQGLLSPLVRVALSFAFGLALLAGAELAHRFEKRLADPRVRQALAGAGLATLYAAFYLAGTTYGLIGAGLAFAGLALVTASAIALSYRYGLPCAILGLVGGFAAPALVTSVEPNIPLLTIYLSLVTAGLAYTGQRQDRPWLGVAALAGGFLWGLVLLIGGVEGQSAIASVGLMIVGLGAFIPMLLSSLSPRPWQRLGAAAIASVQMAALVFQAGFAPLTWGLYLLLGSAIAVLAWRKSTLREANGVVAAVGISLLLLWPQPSLSQFILVAAALAALTCLVPLALVLTGRARSFDFWQICGASLGLGVSIYHQAGNLLDGANIWALAAAILSLAIVPALAAWRIWQALDIDGEQADAAQLRVLTVASAALLAFGASLIALPAVAHVFAGAAITAALFALWLNRPETGLNTVAWASATISLAALIFVERSADELFWAVGGPSSETTSNLSWLGALRWGAIAALMGLFAVFERPRTSEQEGAGYGIENIRQRLAESGLAIAAYVAIAQIIPSALVPKVMPALTLSAAIAALWYFRNRRAGAYTAIAIVGAWALAPLGIWLQAGVEALAGTPLLRIYLPTIIDTLTRILPLGVAGLVLSFFAKDRLELQFKAGLAIAGAGLGIALHIAFKQALALETLTRFVELGLLERTLWQALLIALGYGLFTGMGRIKSASLGRGLIVAALAHFAWFSLGLHNPLWDEQAAGPLPIANLILGSYAAGLAGLYLLGRSLPQDWSLDWKSKASLMLDACTMALILLLGLSLLRQVFAGSIMPPVPLSGTEDLLRSLLGIVLAIAFLIWGSRQAARVWRLGSLVLMVGAVLKVFLIDAAGLTGLLRIASFAALGFSLIGLGWLYSRQLSSSKDSLS